MSALPVNQRESASRIGAALDDLRKMIRSYVVTQAGVLVVIGFIAAFWITGFLDYFPVMLGASESPRWARIGILLSMLCGLIYLIFHLGWQKWKVTWNDSTLALLIERKFPQFQSALITTVQAHERQNLVAKLHSNSKRGSSSQLKNAEAVSSDLQAIDASILQPHDPQLLLQTTTQAVQTLEKIDVKEVLRWSPLQWQAASLGGLLAMSLLFAAWQPAWTWHWSQRLFGLSNIAWPRLASIRVEGLEMDIPRFANELTPMRYVRPFVEGARLRAQRPVRSIARLRRSERGTCTSIVHDVLSRQRQSPRTRKST